MKNLRELIKMVPMNIAYASIIDYSRANVLLFQYCKIYMKLPQTFGVSHTRSRLLPVALSAVVSLYVNVEIYKTLFAC